MHLPEQVIFSNMCMVQDAQGNVVVQERVDPNWPGIVFPGGHVEPGETFAQAVIREVLGRNRPDHPSSCPMRRQALDGS